MAIEIRLNEPMVAVIDKEGFRRMIRFVLAGGSRDYSWWGRAGARALGWGHKFGRKKLTTRSADRAEAREGYALDAEAGQADLLREPAAAGALEGTYGWPITVKSDEAPSQAQMNHLWSRVPVDRDVARNTIFQMLGSFDPTGRIASDGAGAADDQPLLTQTRGQRTSTELLKSNVFDAATRVTLHDISSDQRRRIVDMLCPP